MNGIGMNDIISAVQNRHDAGIIDKIEKSIRPKPENNKFLFFSTGSQEMLLNGIEIDLTKNYDPDQCKKYLLEQLRRNKIIKEEDDIDLLIYLSGGIPFLGGVLNDLYSNKTVKKYIYGIITRPFPNDVLNKKYYNPCDISDDIHKQLLSPVCDSTLIGLCDVACLLGYLINGGPRSERLLRSCAATARFPPLITCLNRIIDRNGVTGRDIITVCSSFHAFFTALIKSVIQPEQIFDYALRCCNMITHIKNIPESLPIDTIDLDNEESKAHFPFLVKLKQPQYIYLWKADYNEEFNYVKFDPFDPRAIEDANKSFASFSPIAPLSTRYVTGCSIVKGKDHSFLYLSQSPIKRTTNLVDMIDPTTGKADSVDIEKFAQMQGNLKIDNVANLIDPDSVKEIIMVCFDRSSSMNEALDGSCCGNDTPSRTVIATQYLISFAYKAYGYRIPCILGLISFNDELTLRCPLSPLIPDFEEKGVKNITATGWTRLWDVLCLACDELNSFTTDDKGDPKFPGARKRILAISDGEDSASKLRSIDAIKKLLDSHIMLDSVIVSGTDMCKELAALSHMTGGISIRPKDINEGMRFFEQSAFLDSSERNNPTKIIIPSKRMSAKNIKASNVTNEMIQEAMSSVKFDDSIPNKILSRVQRNTRLATPRFICFMNQTIKLKTTRERRLLRELHYASLVMDESNYDYYDPDLVIYPFRTNLDIWQVYMKAPLEDPYIGKWFFLTVTFPPTYPIEPPFIRFVSIPYNLNVSSEGRICFDVLEKGYIPSYHVIDIIQRIKIVFITPIIETPIQIEILDTFLFDRAEYDRLAKESAKNVGKDDYKDFFPDHCVIEDDVDKGFQLVYDDMDKIPKYMKSQISGRVFKDPVIPPSVGVRYERNELIQLVSTNRNPRCVITGRPITETEEQINALPTAI